MRKKIQKNRLNKFVAIFCYALVAAQLNFDLAMIVILQYHIEQEHRGTYENIENIEKLTVTFISRKVRDEEKTIMLGKERENVRMAK